MRKERIGRSRKFLHQSSFSKVRRMCALKWKRLSYFRSYDGVASHGYLCDKASLKGRASSSDGITVIYASMEFALTARDLEKLPLPLY